MNTIKKFSPFANVSIRNKILTIQAIALIAVALTSIMSFAVITKSMNENDKKRELYAVNVCDEVMEMAVEGGVAVTGSIYGNSAVYDFIDKNYSSSSEYYNAYYTFQQNSPSLFTDTGTVKGYTIYTSNSTVIKGNNIALIEAVEEEQWYKTFKRLNKPIILFVDPDTSEISLIRKLDYYTLESGECIVKTELNTDFIKKCADKFEFDGKLYITSGNVLIYSNDSSFSDADVLKGFEADKTNFYSADIEYFAKAGRTKKIDGFYGLWILVFIILLTFVSLIVLGIMFSNDIDSRIDTVSSIFAKDHNLLKLSGENCGKDEIGEVIDMCISVSERLNVKNSEYKISVENLSDKSTDYYKLFTTAMRLDAELAIAEKYGKIYSGTVLDETSLNEEIEKMCSIARVCGKQIVMKGKPNEDITIPAYSVSLIADNIFTAYGIEKIKISNNGDNTVFSFTSSNNFAPLFKLKLNAIFEENEVIGDYSFSHFSDYNPYLRLKHCMGERAGIKVEDNLIEITVYKKDRFI